MYVDDLARAIFFILEKKISKNRKLLKIIKKNPVINLGSGKHFSIKQFAKIICQLSKKKSNLKFNKKYPDGTMRKILDNKIIKSLGWKPKFLWKRVYPKQLSGTKKIIFKYRILKK